MRYWYDKDWKCIVCEPNCADEWLEHIWQIGVDYDGCNSVESLKGLVDELVEMSQKARYCLEEGKLFRNMEEDRKSHLEAVKEREKDMEG